MRLNAADGIGHKPTSLAFDGVNMWIGNEDDNTITIVRAHDGALVKVIPCGGVRPIALAFDGANMWVTNGNSDTVSKM